MRLFELNILPSDASLIEPFLVRIQLALIDEEFIEVDDGIKAHFQLVARVLFTIVITRVYMAKQPKDDLQIYALALDPSKMDQLSTDLDPSLAAAKSSRLSRQLTEPEKAALSCIAPKKGPSGTWSHNKDYIGGLTGFAEVDHFQHLQRVIDTSINIVPVIEALDIHGSAYVFVDEFTDQGLTGSDIRQTTKNSNTENTVVPSIEPHFTGNPSTESSKPVTPSDTVLAAQPDPQQLAHTGAPPLIPSLNTPQARMLIEDYVGWTKPSEGLKATADPEALRRSKRITKEDLK